MTTPFLPIAATMIATNLLYPIPSSQKWTCTFLIKTVHRLG